MEESGLEIRRFFFWFGLDCLLCFRSFLHPFFPFFSFFVVFFFMTHTHAAAAAVAPNVTKKNRNQSFVVYAILIHSFLFFYAPHAHNNIPYVFTYLTIPKFSVVVVVVCWKCTFFFIMMYLVDISFDSRVLGST